MAKRVLTLALVVDKDEEKGRAMEYTISLTPSGNFEVSLKVLADNSNNPITSLSHLLASVAYGLCIDGEAVDNESMRRIEGQLSATLTNLPQLIEKWKSDGTEFDVENYEKIVESYENFLNNQQLFPIKVRDYE